MPAIGTPCTASASDALPYASLDDRTSGSMLAGIPNSRSSSSSHSQRWMSNSIVRDALLTSVTCCVPPVSFHINHASTVPPDDRVVDRLSGFAIPDDRRLALVGDADGGDLFRRQLRATQRL